MAKYVPIALGRFLSISADCLGTYPADEHQWRLERKGGGARLSKEAQEFARCGGIGVYRHRRTCHVCQHPDVQVAEINLAIHGMPVRNLILVQVRDQAIAERLQLATLLGEEAEGRQIDVHTYTLATLVERNSRSPEWVIHGLADLLPANLEALIDELVRCGGGCECMESCPICAAASPRQDQPGRYLREGLARWLVSYTG